VLGVDHRDHPVRGHPLDNDEPAVGGLLDVLADHRGQQLGGLGDLGAKLPAAQRAKGPVAIAEQRVHQLLAGDRVLPVTDRLTRGHIVVIALERRPDQSGQFRRAGP
jgi:hypothetical protein